MGALFLHSKTYREQYFQYGGSLDGVIELFQEMIELGWADKKPELLLEIPLGLFRCIQEKIQFYEKSRYGRFCKFCQVALKKLGKKDPIERGLYFLAGEEFRTLSPYLKKQILELTRQHIQAEEKKLKEALSKAGQIEDWKAESHQLVAAGVFRSIHGLLGHVDLQMIDRVFYELSEKREPKFEKWVFCQVGLHLPTLLEEKQKTWAVQAPSPENPPSA